jgi:SAM-dependent methyltransferase
MEWWYNLINNDNKSSISCKLCNSDNTNLIAAFKKKPAAEIELNIPAGSYHREIYHCQDCDVYFNSFKYNLDELYEESYNKSTYNHKLLENYKKIRGLPFEKSDNKHRVKRVAAFASQQGFNFSKSKVLDIGSGLSVFIAEMQELGFKGYCIDPDPIAIQHAVDNVKVAGGHSGSIYDFSANMKFEIISFNKVLEHVLNPIAVLKKASGFLSENGFIYIELPDGRNAIKNGSVEEREEFFIEHHFIFTPDSVSYLIDKAGLSVVKIEEIRDPSGKYTLYAFIKNR